MLLFIALLYLQLCSANFDSFDNFILYAIKTNTSVSDYALRLGFQHFDRDFRQFKIQNNRKYVSDAEEYRRKFNFLRTLDFIESHNRLFERGDVLHRVGINLFADLSPEEYDNTFSMTIPIYLNNVTNLKNTNPIVLSSSSPKSFDWRQFDKVTAVKNQGNCGSCWAFTTIATIESGYAIHTNQSLGLSEQQLVDCMKSHCKGQHINKGLDYVLKNGIQTNTDYPYLAKANDCRDRADKYHVQIKGYATLGKAAGLKPATDAEIMTAVMTNGPVGFILEASGKDFAYYRLDLILIHIIKFDVIRSGVLTTSVDTSKGWKSVHSMTIVGWDSINGTDYWIAKNSWGTGWGEKGFVKLVRGKSLRGMNYYIYYPKF